MKQRINRFQKLNSFLTALSLIKPLKRAELEYILSEKNPSGYISYLVVNKWLEIDEKEYKITKKAKKFLSHNQIELIYLKNLGISQPVHNLALVKALYHILVQNNHQEIYTITKERTTGQAIKPDITIESKEVTHLIEIDTGTQGLKVVQQKINRYNMTLLQDNKNVLTFFTKSKKNYEHFKGKYSNIEFIFLDDKFIFDLNKKTVTKYDLLNKEQEQKTESQNQAKLQDELRNIWN